MAMTPLPSPSSQEQTELARAIIDDIRTTTPTLGVRGDTWALLRRIETACEGEIAKRASAVSPERTPPTLDEYTAKRLAEIGERLAVTMGEPGLMATGVHARYADDVAFLLSFIRAGRSISPATNPTASPPKR